MVIQNKLRTHEVRLVCIEKHPICDCSRSNQMPETDRITEIAQSEHSTAPCFYLLFITYNG